MLRAINAGVDSIEHGTYMDKEVMDAMIKNDTYMVPTILAGEWVAEKSRIDMMLRSKNIRYIFKSK